MVYVAGRSRGCVTCRKRRVKCDEQHPACNRCIKGGRVCGGYQQNNFVSYQRDGKTKAPAPSPDTLPSTRNAVLVVRTSPRDRQASDSPESSSESDLHGWEREDAAVGRADELQGLTFVWQSSPPPFVDLRGFQDDVFLSYTRVNMLKGTNPLDGPDQHEVALPFSRLAHDCILTISTAYFGRRHYQEEIRQLGLRRYGEVLTELNKALVHPVNSKSLMVLSAIQTLSFYELLAPSDPLAWINHARGIEQLLVHRGPELHMEGRALAMFQRVRITIAYASLLDANDCLLATPEWCSVPWSLHPERKPLFQKLLDILLYMPPHKRNILHFYKQDRPSAADLEKLLDARTWLRSAHTMLDEWWVEFQAIHHSDYWLAPPESYPTDLQSSCTWSPTYEFRDLPVAANFGNYHATMVHVCDFQQRIDRYLNPMDFEHLDELAARTRHSSVEICRATQYHLHPQHAGGGSIYLTYPLKMAWNTMGGDTPEGDWLRQVAYMMAEARKGAWEGLPLL